MAIDGLAFLALIVASLAAFRGLSMRFGVDSREAFVHARTPAATPARAASSLTPGGAG